MSRINDLLAAEYIGRHCTNPECRKCRARAHWYRRKAWRSGKKPVRIKNRRK
jgi:hypothetical protein